MRKGGLLKTNLSPLQNRASTLITWNNCGFLIGEIKKKKMSRLKGC